MSAPRVRLTGVDEGLSVTVRTHILGADDGQRIAEAFAAMFPDAPSVEWPTSPVFPTEQDLHVEVLNVPLDTYLTKLHDQRILDTALDVMGSDLNANTTVFSIQRVAALSGKVTFRLPGHAPLGGVFDIEISGEGLEDWLLAATHHQGRAHVPRQIGDERAMDEDGEAVTWFER
ncbi:MAG TPA: hypothetical protein HA286_03070 [Candidatus Poseidoniaceae archaeon]|nr:hypothetical protein [Candidatus Poseidoniaceae archaeon]